ncbi:hypothetical protein C7212DRAFT_363610 [Tuber magnatum]|uniref:Uncharacterized protein n=1 Tax=Tuber magnatum TaxID=42249 RepID=A0A317SQK8_9PEZI|nr:hypothetical protein C7212DRAFT_363610 [Tuber magnatum]
MALFTMTSGETRKKVGFQSSGLRLILYHSKPRAIATVGETHTSRTPVSPAHYGDRFTNTVDWSLLEHSSTGSLPVLECLPHYSSRPPDDCRMGIGCVLEYGSGTDIVRSSGGGGGGGGGGCRSCQTKVGKTPSNRKFHGVKNPTKHDHKQTNLKPFHTGSGPISLTHRSPTAPCFPPYGIALGPAAPERADTAPTGRLNTAHLNTSAPQNLYLIHQ